MDSSTEETPILPKQPAKRNEIRLGPKIQLEIFRFMSRRDLRRACRKVCFEWRDLIDENPNTLPLINVKPRQNHWLLNIETGSPRIDECKSVPPLREFLLLVAFVLFSFTCFIVYLIVHSLLTLESALILFVISLAFVLAYLYQRCERWFWNWITSGFPELMRRKKQKENSNG
ncbi:hypothetical protein DdX_02797 [Ditylenchus destructor]|uniref:F-box domain-containing protein n=1 Tax=Ditylenchus destructor TaxID=166010 RepID=A0AAD4NEU9_9BILA|nr:hypothetical protein DdX_02797 [Ditylenchus destructor]